MSCEYIYKDKKYTQAEFMALLYNGELEALTNKGKLSLGEFPKMSVSEKQSVQFLGKPRVATFFSGAGTMEAALPDSESVMAVEFNPQYMEAYNDAFGVKYNPKDVNEVTPQEVKNANPDIFHASPVCKNFSAAKNVKTVEKSDMDSAESVARIIKEATPPIVTIENVPQYEGTVPFNLIIDALKQAGYKYDVGVYNAADYGGVQNRKRLLVRAVKEGELPPLPEKQKQGDWYSAIEDLIDDAPSSSFESKTKETNWEYARIQDMIERGKLDATKPIITMGGSAFKGEAQAANAGSPAPTLKSTSKETPRILMPNGDVKKVTPEMMRRLMGLPDTYPIPNNPKLAKEVLGNGMEGNFTKALIEPLLATPQNKLAKAERELKDAWDNYKKLGAIFDAVESAKKDLALIKAIVNYAIQRGLKTIDEITDMVKQSLPNAKQLKDDVLKRIELASEIVSGTRKYSDVLLEKYVANNLITQSSVGAMQKIASDNTENGILDINKAMQAVDNLRVPKSIKEACREYLNEVKAEEQAPQQEPVAEPIKKAKQQVLDKIFDVLTKRISSVNMPDFITADLNGTAKQQTSITTGEIEGRDIPNEYVQVTLDNLQEVAESDSASFMQEFGEDWIDTVLQAIEMSGSNGRGYPNYARVIGVLNAMSTQINQSMATNTTKAGKDKLDNLQARVDAQANIFARESSLGLRMRQILRVFAEGSSIAEILANKIISTSIAEAKSDIEQAVKKRYSDAELNNANRPITNKKQAQATAQAEKETNSKNDVLDSIKAKKEVREKTNGKMQLNDRVQQLKEKLKNLKCS